MPRLGRFALVRRIGEGAHGVVYEAEDLARGDRVALKTLRKGDARIEQALRREFRAFSGIAHENLVQLHELFAEGDDWYFTMELVEGLDFGAYVRATGGTSPDGGWASLRAVLRSLVEGVRAIHRAGKLHRDLKPSNARVTASGRLVLLDYGLLASRARDSRAGGMPSERACGTLEYMAPELLRGAPASTASDVYAIGVMLFVALTGRLPFRGRARGSDPVSELVRLAPHAPRDLQDLCGAMLSPGAASRPSIEQLRARLAAKNAGPDGSLARC